MHKVTDEKLMDIISQFDLPGEILEIRPCGNGHINDTFRLNIQRDGRQEIYTLQRMNGDVFKNCDQLMENIQKVTAFLKDKISVQGGNSNWETLQIISAKDGKSYIRDENQDGWRMYSFIPNTVTYDRAETLDMFKKSGYAFGNFQHLLEDFPASELHETIVNFHNTVDRFAKFQKAVSEDAKNRAQYVQEEIAFIQNREKDCHFFGDLLANREIPLRVTHNDTKLNNVLFSEETGDAVCVIDLDTVMPGLAAHDFGDAIRFGASTAAEDEPDLSKVSCSMELYEAYLDGFMEGCRGSLTPKEIETLPMGAKIMTFEVGMRFLTDYLEGDVYFKTHREGQNLDRCRTQLKLVADMEAKWETMCSMVRKFVK